ncbi:heparinase II/III domain-containing protein [Salinicoccus albus]|uniref:heparinase II/III domain-containing protein n=1 Tax=Salinicoccus albus TaxID=418756 RepID=UPI00039FF6FB|nr:heparinase II/III family protein [Salinicoccus albus]
MSNEMFTEYIKEQDESELEVLENDVFPLLKYKTGTKMAADNALENIIIPFTNFDPVKFDENYWFTDKKKKYGDSYQLYIQSMRVCAEILNEYAQTEDERYLYKAKEIIMSWIHFVTNGTEEKMVWYDHPTASRTQVIIQFLFLSKKTSIEIDEHLFKAVLQKHGEVLSDDSKYKNNNHGLMMDKALMVLGNVLNDSSLFMRGYYRAIDTFWYSFSYNGIHIENSPDYHMMVTRMYEEIEQYLNSRGKSFGTNINRYLELAKIYPQILLKPDRAFPAIGDSGNAKKKVNKIYRNLYDEEAGISVLQYGSPKPLYVSFISGYSSKVHKHKDDLSITLNYNGADFFEDPGKYNYSKTKERKYIISRRAHSSFFMKEFDYTIKPENRFDRKVRLKGYIDNSIYAHVIGENGDYNGSSAVLARNVILFKNAPLIIIIDNVDTTVRHKLKFTQNFNLASNVEIEDIEGKYRLTSKGESLCVEQFEKIDERRIISGDFEKPVAINTTGFGKAEKTNQLRYEKASNKGNVYCTAIYDDNVVSDVNLVYQDDSVHIEFNGEQYTIYQ